MVNVVITLILVLVVGAALFYIRREKKNGAKCVGCPYSKTCSSGACPGGAAQPNRK